MQILLASAKIMNSSSLVEVPLMSEPTYKEQASKFAQDHLFISSFLYGMLRPLDRIHPYRMEGKVKLEAANGENLFSFWKPLLTDRLIESVKADDGILIHLATEEF